MNKKNCPQTTDVCKYMKLFGLTLHCKIITDQIPMRLLHMKKLCLYSQLLKSLKNRQKVKKLRLCPIEEVENV